MKRQLVNLATHPTAFVTPPQLAAYLDCDRRTILRMIHDDALPASRVGRNWRIPIEAARRAFPNGDQVPRETSSRGMA